MTVPQILDAISQGGFVVALLLLIIAGARRIWVYGWMWEHEKEQNDKLLEINERLSRSLETALGIGGRDGRP